MTTASTTSLQDASAVALTTVFTPATTCGGLTFSAPNYSIWYNEPVPAPKITESGCYPSQFLDGYSSLSTSSVAPALNPLVCPSGWTTAFNSSSSYIACCPTGYAVHRPDTTIDTERPAYGGVCFSGFTPTTLTVVEYNSTGLVQTQTVPFTVSGQVYAHVIDGWAAQHVLATSTADANSTGPTSSTASTAPDQDNGLTGGAIAGVVVGCLAGVLALLGSGCFLLRRRRTRRQSFSEDGRGYSEPPISESTALAVHESDPSAAVLEKEGSPVPLQHHSSGRGATELSSESGTAQELECPPLLPTPAELDSNFDVH